MGFNQAPALPYRNLGIVEDGDTASQAIEKDKYIIWKGQNYFAKTDILQGETFVVDTNLTAMPEGVINGIVDTLNASIISEDRTATLASGEGYTILSDLDSSVYEMISAYPYRNFNAQGYSDASFMISVTTTNSGLLMLRFFNENGSPITSAPSVKFHIMYRRRQ